ncbi:MAG: hypothetical protein ABIO16_16900 [Nocardioides sp.]
MTTTQEDTSRGALHRVLRWLLAPATEEVPRAQALGAAALRIFAGLLWLYNVSWKHAPDFGREAGSGLYRYTAYAVSNPVFPPYSWVIEHVVLKAFVPFAWAVLAVETALAVMLLTGAWVRLAAAIGLAQVVAITLSAVLAPNEWPWSYWMMLALHATVLVSSAGRVLAIDAVRAGISSPRSLGRAWAIAAIVLGLVSVVRSLGDPFAARGEGIGVARFSFGLGDFNLLGGLVLMLAGGLLLLHARGGPARAASAAAAVAVLCALSLYAQLGFSDPLLGGTTTSAATLLSIAVVALVASGAVPSHRHTDQHAAHPDETTANPTTIA